MSALLPSPDLRSYPHSLHGFSGEAVVNHVQGLQVPSKSCAAGFHSLHTQGVVAHVELEQAHVGERLGEDPKGLKSVLGGLTRDDVAKIRLQRGKQLGGVTDEVGRANSSQQ